MSSFDNIADRAGGRTKSNYEPEQPVLDSDLTTVDSSAPHFIRCAIRREPTVEEFEGGKKEPIEIATWALGPFPTRDAADSHAQDVRQELKHIRGEPEQAYSEIAKMTRCPNPGLLPKFKNLHLTLHPAPQRKSEPIPNDHPAYPNSFSRDRDTVTGLKHTGIDLGPGGPAPGSSGKAGDGANPAGPRKVRRRTAKAASPVPASRGGRKAAKGKAKQGPAKSGKRRGD